MTFLSILTQRNLEVEEREEMSVGSTAFAALFGSTTKITEENVMKIPTAEACINLISSSIAQMPIYLYKEKPDGSVERIIEDKRVILLNDEPNELLNGFNFKKQIVKDYLLHGGAFISVEKMGNNATELYPLPARNLSITKYVKDGYKISADINLSTMEGIEFGAKKEIKFKPYELMIALADSKDGITSVGLLEKGEKIFQQAMDEMEYIYNIFQRGALPLGLLKTGEQLNDAAINRLRQSWANLYGGIKNSAKTVVLEAGMEYQGLSMNPADLQLNDSKNGTYSEICKLFGVPESMISTAANKYGSIEQNQLHFLKHCLAPIITSIETSANKSLLLEKEKEEGYYFRFDTAELLRTTEKERIETIERGLKAGIYRINEARGKLDLPAIDDNVFMWGLENVLYNPDTGEMKVPNMGLTNGQPNQNGGQTNDQINSVSKPDDSTSKK